MNLTEPAPIPAGRAASAAANEQSAGLYDENLVTHPSAQVLETSPMIARSVTLTVVAKDFAGARAALEAATHETSRLCGGLDRKYATRQRAVVASIAAHPGGGVAGGCD